MAVPRWNPREVLEVDTLNVNFTCTGITLKNQRCKNRVNKPDRKEAAALLTEISMLRPNSSASIRKLENLASLTLCIRDHRWNQVEKTCSRWESVIEEYVSTRAAAVQRASAPITQQRVRTSPVTTANTSAITVRTERAHQATPATRLHNLPPLRPLPRIRDHQTPQITPTPPDREPQTRTPEPPITALPTGPFTFRANVQLICPASPSLAPDGLSNTSTPVRLAASASLSFQGTSALRLAGDEPNEPSAATLDHVHREESTTNARQVVRRPITEDCAICYEEICCKNSAVWCRGQCGQNVHKSCFEQWRLTISRDAEARRMDEGEGIPNSTATCIYCRAPWVDD